MEKIGTIDEGYIKFHCNWIQDKPMSMEHLREINEWRDKMYQRGWIGIYDNGVGFGNISVKAPDNKFIVSGSETGGLEKLNENHYCVVEGYDFAKNNLTCRGPIKASSESLSHAAVYESSPETQAVIHIHNLEMWERLVKQVAVTDKNAAFGTPEMAVEVKKIARGLKDGDKKILAMGGHEEGVISWGKTLDEAGSYLLWAAGDQA